MNRFTWPLGIFLLIGSIVGAGWALNQTTPHPTGDAPAAYGPLPYVFCLGRVDVPNGVAGLYPTQPGEVTEITATRVKDKDGIEGECVFKKGEVLLRLRSDLARTKLEQAKLALAAADVKLEEAHRLVQARDQKLAGQKAIIEAARQEKIRLEADLAGKKKSAQDNIGKLNKTTLDAMVAAVAEADAKIHAQEATLRIVEIADPRLKVREAELDVKAKKLDIQAAQDYLDGFALKAPFDGMVLRVHTQVGEVLGPNPKAPALEFCPNVPHVVKAEVVQEWGDRVRVGQEVEVFDDTYQGPQWQGKVKSLSPWYAQKRDRIVEPFMMNDVRTLECLIEFTGQTPTRIHQRVRVKINVVR